MGESVIYQDILQKGRQIGRAEGRVEGRVEGYLPSFPGDPWERVIEAEPLVENGARYELIR